ncbi:superoxide dismutase family protein [Sporosarcina highlanderae]|uniref:Superoxide dismutase family protein n=1 Tax=Sporosarcina highlanderae TaxID=3035916 RepID=A0ABT8JMP1_9BACL|nr:superoxide dismutase family protein [Sporosarcina highlanderae]MDN4606428.1 superoxide dismutase family protein [Sporosarcina highlanderae]
MRKKMIIVLLMTAILFVAGCGKSKKAMPVSGEKMETIIAPLINTEGKKIGEVTLVQEKEGVMINVEAKGLKPGLHGIHIHETGVCTAPDFKSSGAHFNPTGKEHGFDNPKGWHLGDLPNIEVPDDGKVSMQLTNGEITLKPGQENSILDGDGSALVIHADPDDNKTDPSGNSGDRIACAALTSKK